MDAKSLIRLHFHKNKDGTFSVLGDFDMRLSLSVFSISDAYHCPVTFKVFNENTHIVAVRSTGNVYSYEVHVGIKWL